MSGTKSEKRPVFDIILTSPLFWVLQVVRYSQKRKRTTLKTLEKRHQMHKLNHKSWFHSFVPFKVSAGRTAPLIPILTPEVGGGPTEVGVVNAVGSLASMLGGPFWGKLSDRLNRRKAFLILGFLGSAIATFFFSLAHTVHQVMFINEVYTFFIAATIPIPILIITKTVQLEDRDHAIGKFNEIGIWAWVAGMVIGLLVV